MNQLNKYLFLLISSAVLSLFWSVPIASAESNHPFIESILGTEHKMDDEKGHEHYFSDTMVKLHAKELGIEIEGKDMETLKAEVYEALIMNAAEELGIEIQIEDTSIEDVKKKVHQAKVIKKAEELGIEPNGKDAKTLAKMVYEANIKQKAKELGISTKQKDTKELKKIIMEKKIKQEADALGIRVDGKQLRDLAKEVQETKVFQAANQLGINKDGKSVDEILDTIITDYYDEAKSKGVYPFEGELH